MFFGSGAGRQAYHLHGGTFFFAGVGVCYCIIFLHTQHHTLFLLTPCCKLFLITFHAKQIKINMTDFISEVPCQLHIEFTSWVLRVTISSSNRCTKCCRTLYISSFKPQPLCWAQEVRAHLTQNQRGWNRRPKPAAPLHNVLYIWSC